MQVLQHVRLMLHLFSSNDVTSEGIPTRYIGIHFYRLQTKFGAR